MKFKAMAEPTAGQTLVDGERQEQYGDAIANMERIADGWSMIIGAVVRPQDVPVMMIWLKLVRESQHHLDANVDDIEGYAEILRRVTGGREQ